MTYYWNEGSQCGISGVMSLLPEHKFTLTESNLFSQIRLWKPDHKSVTVTVNVINQKFSELQVIV
jgi:hypothetical protein